MKALLAILLKYIILFTIVTFTLIFVFTNNIGYKEIKYIFLILAVVYICVCCIEAELIASLLKGTKRFIYFTDGFVSKRFLKIIFFVCAGGILLFPHSIINYFSFTCFLIAAAEIVVTFWRYTRKLCFIAFEDDRIILSTNKIITVYAANIEKIEVRHGITYFVYNGKAAITLRTDMMIEKDAFKEALTFFIAHNHLEGKVIASS